VDIQKYIASGILEAYALGDLTATEASEVAAMVAQYPELQLELDAIEADFENLAMATAIQPSVALDDIVSKMQNSPAITASKDGDNIKESKIIPFDQEYYIRRIGRLRAMTIAASVVALVAAALAINYYGSAKASENALAALETEREEYAQNYDMVKQRLDGLQNDIDIIDNPNNERIALAGTEVAPDALAYAYWDKSAASLYLSIQNLKELADNQQYQLWAIIDGKPIDAGVFDWNAEGLVAMKSFGEGVELFAVTIEPKGGSAGPTLETMQVAGAPGSKS